MTTEHMAIIAIGDKLRRFRLESGLSQRGLAEKAHIHYSNISYYENGKRDTIQPGTAKKIAEAFSKELGRDVQLSEFTRIREEGE